MTFYQWALLWRGFSTASTFAITGSEKRGDEGAPLFTVRVDGVVRHAV
jgi:hypothetical protein